MNHILLSIKQIMNKIFLEGDDPPPTSQSINYQNTQ